MRLNAGIIDRYLMREAGLAWMAVTLVLLLLMMGSGFARYLGRAAAGKQSPELVLELVGLSSLEYLVLVIPISIMLAIMLALGRHYRDNEMAAIGAAGIGLVRMYRPYIWLILLVAAITGWLSLDLSPWASGKVNVLRDLGRNKAKDLSAFEPGKFRVVMKGRGVFYTEAFDSSSGTYRNVFLRAQNGKDTLVILAAQGEQGTNPYTQESVLILRDGYRYEGQPGQVDYTITAFREHGVRIEYQDRKPRVKPGEKPLDQLISSEEWNDSVEIHWRLSVPVTVLLLGLLAVPLAHVKPRQGRYAQLVVALLIYMLYSNLLTAGRLWIEDTQVSPFIGLWSIHLGLLVIVLALVGRREGWWRRKGGYT